MVCEVCRQAQAKTREERMAQACASCLAKRVARSYALNRAADRCEVAQAHARPKDPEHPKWGSERDAAFACFVRDYPTMCPVCIETKERIASGDLQPI
jgi:hypothetical protein